MKKFTVDKLPSDYVHPCGTTFKNVTYYGLYEDGRLVILDKRQDVLESFKSTLESKVS